MVLIGCVGGYLFVGLELRVNEDKKIWMHDYKFGPLLAVA